MLDPRITPPGVQQLSPWVSPEAADFGPVPPGSSPDSRSGRWLRSGAVVKLVVKNGHPEVRLRGGAAAHL